MKSKVNKPLYRRVWFWIIIVLFVWVGTMSIVSSNSDSDKSEKSTSSQKVKSSNKTWSLSDADKNKMNKLVDAEKDVRLNLMSSQYDSQLFTSEYAQLKKVYKKYVGEDIASAPEQYLAGANDKANSGTKALSGGLYVGAFKYLNTQLANKISESHSNQIVKQMHDRYLEQ